EETAGHELDAVAEGRLVAHRLGQVEDDAPQLGAATDQLDEQRAVAAADVDDDLALAPLETREPLGGAGAFSRHRRVERRAVGGMLREPLPETGAEPVRERSPGRRRVEIRGRLEERANEEVPGLAPTE